MNAKKFLEEEPGQQAGAQAFLNAQETPMPVEPVQLSNENISNVLNANANKNFVQRILHPEKYPSLPLGPGQVGTHLMAWSTVDNKPMVYPTIIQNQSGQLQKLNPKEALDYALKTGEFIGFNTEQEADQFSKNYKNVWQQKKKIFEPGPAFESLKNIAKVYPALETAANVFSQGYGLPASGIAGLMALPWGPEKAKEVQDWIAERTIYQPKTEQGKQLTKATFYPISKLFELGDKAEQALEKTKYTDVEKAMIGPKGAEYAPVIAKTMIQALPLALPLLRRGREISPAPRRLEAPRPESFETKYLRGKFQDISKQTAKEFLEEKPLELTEEVKPEAKLPPAISEEEYVNQRLGGTKPVPEEKPEAVPKMPPGTMARARPQGVGAQLEYLNKAMAEEMEAKKKPVELTGETLEQKAEIQPKERTEEIKAKKLPPGVMPKKVEPELPAPKPEAKEPWEMSKKEFDIKSQAGPIEEVTPPAQMAERIMIGKSGLTLAREDVETIRVTLDNRYSVDIDVNRKDLIENPHKAFIEQALSEGKPVPPEVLAEYSDLKPKPPVEAGKGGEGQPSIEIPKTRPVDKRVERFRTFADNLQKQIDEKRNPAIGQLNVTARRSRIAAGMADDADRLERIQNVLRGMSDDLESGNLPESLQGIKNKKQIEKLLTYVHFETKYGDKWGWAKIYDDDQATLKSAGITLRNYEQAKKDIASYLEGPSKEVLKERKMKELERDLIGRKIPGFFPTPKPIINRMLDEADIEPGMKVLEPSAGKGDIADAIKEKHPDSKLSNIEINADLRTILEHKGHELVDWDFLKHQDKYDRIVMNPPFEKGQDIDHIRHAYDLLKPGGRLVSIMSEGPFFRNDKKSVEFREWLESEGGESEKLTSKSFTGKEAFRQTGAASRIVIIDKVKAVESGPEFYSGIPFHKIPKVYQKLIGDPLWDKVIQKEVPKVLDKIPGGKGINRAFLREYRGNLEQTERYIKNLDEMRKNQQLGRQYGIDLGKRLQALPEESQLRIGEAIRGELDLKHLTEAERELAKESRDAMYDLGRQAAGFDLMSEYTFFKHAGQYMPRLYTKRTYEGLLRRYNIKKPNRLDLTRFKRRQDIPPEIRRQMGEILTPGYPIAKGIMQLTHDIHLMRFFKGIASEPKWSIPKTPLYDKSGVAISYPKKVFDPTTGQYTREWITKKDYQRDPPKGWIQLEKNPKLGPLSEAYVHPEIYKDISKTIEILSTPAKVWRKALGLWKVGKIVNPKTMARNLFGGNVIMSHLGGFPIWEQPWFYAKGYKAMIEKGKYHQLAVENDLFGTTWTAGELKKLLGDAVPEISGTTGKLEEGLGVLNKIWARTEAVAQKGSKAYQSLEEWSKVSHMIYDIERRKMSPTEAAKDAKKWLFDYGEVTDFQEKYRRAWYGAPFATFTFKAMPRIAEALAKTPWRFAPVAGVIWGLEKATMDFVGDTKERAKAKREMIPEWMKGSFLGIPNFARVPIIDKYGNEHYWNLTYYLPWGDIGESGGVLGIPGALMPFSQPFVKESWQQIANRDIFWKSPIVKESDIAGFSKAKQKKIEAIKRLQHAGQAMAPTLSLDIIRAIERAKGKPQVTPSGARFRDLRAVALDLLAGIKIYPVNYVDQLVREISKKNPESGYLAKEIKAEIRQFAIKKKAMEDKGGNIEFFQKAIEQKLEQLKGLAEETKKIGETSKKITKRPIMPIKRKDIQ